MAKWAEPKTQAPVDTAAPVAVDEHEMAPEIAELGATPSAEQFNAVITRLMDRMDKGEAQALTVLQSILDQHKDQLKQTLSPENRLHPDVSDYNPDGERDNPRPALNRPCYFLGMPLDASTLTKAEIMLLNSVTAPLESTAQMNGIAGSEKWKVVLLRDGGGGEALYISVPFKGFDDIKAIPGGWQYVVRCLLTGGSAPVTQDSMQTRIAALEAMIAKMASTVR